MRKLTSQEAKNVILEIFVKFARYCDKYNLRYYMSGGTLLGAVRHKGFIPWDDDIDLLMPRPDFDKLHELLKKEPIEPYYEINGINSGNGIWPFAKILDMRTSVENQFYNCDRHLWIDIFPMDGLPEDKAESDKILAWVRDNKMKILNSQIKIGEGKNLVRKVGKIPKVLLYKMIRPETYAKKIDALARKIDFESSDYIGGIAWSLGPKERMDKKDYESYVELDFEEYKFRAPVGWENYLTKVYGDYMQLPPEDKRYSHDFNAWIED